VDGREKAPANCAVAGANAAVVGPLNAALYDPIFVSVVRGSVYLATMLQPLLTMPAWHLPAFRVVAGVSPVA
jgi:chromate transporter